jgi:hypothetical protein
MGRRYRIRELPAGYYAIEFKRHWWSRWEEECEWRRRTDDLYEAIKRARTLAAPKIVSHEEIFGPRRSLASGTERGDGE